MHYTLCKYGNVSERLLDTTYPLTLTPDEVENMFDCGGNPPVHCYSVTHMHVVDRLKKDLPDYKFNFNRCSYMIEAGADVWNEQYEGLYPAPDEFTQGIPDSSPLNSAVAVMPG
jgi:hypothetical protein